jgi:pimeloyl-ACP methyl ester carboxylesterase
LIDTYTAARAAAAAYSSEPTFVGAGMNQNIHVLRIETGDTVILATRGSAQVRDWWLDFMTGPHPVERHPELGRLHSGFLEAAESVLTAVAAEQTTLNNGKKLVLVGHSLGAAVSLVLAVLLPRLPARVFCFAPPRVFVDFVPASLLPIIEAYRVGNDPVPDQPGWFPHIPVTPIGRATKNPIECHYMGNFLAAFAPPGVPASGPFYFQPKDSNP